MEAVSALPVWPFQSDRRRDDVPPDRRRDFRASQASVIAIECLFRGMTLAVSLRRARSTRRLSSRINAVVRPQSLTNQLPARNTATMRKPQEASRNIRVKSNCEL